MASISFARPGPGARGEDGCMVILVAVPEWIPFAVGGVIVFAGVVALNAARARRRSQAVAAAALQIGFNFEGDKWQEAERGAALTTALFRKGTGRTFRNIVTGSTGGLVAGVFDYSYVESDGKNARTAAQTVAVFSKRGLTMAEFEMEPIGMMQKIGEALVHKNIRFDSNPDFSHRYQLRSPDADRTREVFTMGLLGYLEGLDEKKKWRLEGVGETLIVYRAGKRVDPAELKGFLDEAGAIAGSFFGLGGFMKYVT